MLINYQIFFHNLTVYQIIVIFKSFFLIQVRWSSWQDWSRHFPWQSNPIVANWFVFGSSSVWLPKLEPIFQRDLRSQVDERKGRSKVRRTGVWSGPASDRRISDHRIRFQDRFRRNSTLVERRLVVTLPTKFSPKSPFLRRRFFGMFCWARSGKFYKL